MYRLNYASVIAPTGQSPAHVPQSIQSASLIAYTPPSFTIQPVGQLPSQAPHPMQSAVILYAIVKTPPEKI
jgi:hypothetical protein